MHLARQTRTSCLNNPPLPSVARKEGLRRMLQECVKRGREITTWFLAVRLLDEFMVLRPTLESNPAIEVLAGLALHTAVNMEEVDVSELDDLARFCPQVGVKLLRRLSREVCFRRDFKIQEPTILTFLHHAFNQLNLPPGSTMVRDSYYLAFLVVDDLVLCTRFMPCVLAHVILTFVLHREVSPLHAVAGCTPELEMEISADLAALLEVSDEDALFIQAVDEWQARAGRRYAMSC